MAGSSWSNQLENTLIVASGSQGTGIFLYNGTPAPGNPPVLAAVAPGVTQDPFGNTVSPILNIGTLSAAHVGFDANGVQYLSDSTGTARILLDPQNRVIEFYDSLGTNHNPPLMTLASAAGTDRFTGDAFPAGLALVTGGGPFVFGETWHNVAGGSGVGTVRAQLLPWDSVWLDAQVSWTATGTTTLGSLPSASYYPTQARDFPLSGNAGFFQTASIHVPTSGALTMVVAGTSGTGSGGLSAIYPTN